MRPLLATFASLLLATGACGGGGTVISNPVGGGDQAPSSTDTPPASTDMPPSSGDLTGGGASASIPLCQNPPTQVTACFTCQESSCASEVAPIVAACGAFFQCFQACDCSNSACIKSCEQSATPACATALGSATCSNTSCQSECSTSVSFSGGTTIDAGAVSVGPTTGGGGNGNAPQCTALSTCCASLSSTLQPGCDSVATSGVNASCDSVLKGYQSASLCP